MKKIAAVLCVIALLLSLASCKLKATKEIEEPSPGSNNIVSSREEHYTEDFADASGKVICAIDMTYPVFESEYAVVSDNINSCFEEYKQEKINYIKSNLESTAEYKQKFNIEGVTVTKIVYEIVEVNDTYISVSLNEKRGTNIENATGTTTGYTFTMLDGRRISLQTLLKPDMTYNEKLVKELIWQEANRSYANGAALEEHKREIIDSLFSGSSICCTPTGIIFYYSYETISEGEVDGIYECMVDYGYLTQYMTPEEYYEANYAPLA